MPRAAAKTTIIPVLRTGSPWRTSRTHAGSVAARCHEVFSMTSLHLDEPSPVAPLLCQSGHSLAEIFSRQEVTGRWCLVRTFIAIGLSHGPQETPHTIEILCTATAGVPPRKETETDPLHAMLGCENGKGDQRVEFVAVHVL